MTRNYSPEFQATEIMYRGAKISACERMVVAGSPMSKNFARYLTVNINFVFYVISAIIHTLTERFHRDENILMLS